MSENQLTPFFAKPVWRGRGWSLWGALEWSGPRRFVEDDPGSMLSLTVERRVLVWTRDVDGVAVSPNDENVARVEATVLPDGQVFAPDRADEQREAMRALTSDDKRS